MDFQFKIEENTPEVPRTRVRPDYKLLLSFLDNGWKVRHFNAHEVTLEPATRR